jgi:hypothetical protein
MVSKIMGRSFAADIRVGLACLPLSARLGQISTPYTPCRYILVRNSPTLQCDLIRQRVSLSSMLKLARYRM